MNLSEKLMLIRQNLGFTQDTMAKKLGIKSSARRARISEWESARREPNRRILVKYAELVKIDVGILIDDKKRLVF